MRSFAHLGAEAYSSPPETFADFCKYLLVQMAYPLRLPKAKEVHGHGNR
jgi:hypothetical protein